ncbi:MAG: DUF1731 domain-containing protein [Melioribacteraceae bacterium]|nr:DUF1731 domain-containing protein [Melioribacteraceae bacterium]
MPWIHIRDITDLYIHAAENNEMTGAYNATAPNPVRMKEFAEALGRVLNRPSLFKVPEFVLKIVVGEAADLVLKGSKVIPKRTLESGYKFKFIHLGEALKNIL